MNKEELASKLDGIEYSGWDEIKSMESVAKENGLVIIFGQSDDLLELIGTIDDEISAFEGVTTFLTPDKTTFDEEKNKETFKYNRTQIESFPSIKAEWCPKDKDGKIIASWVISTELPHAKFKIMEDGETYCIGIIIDIQDVLQHINGKW
jgi:hypothetical protein